MKEGRKDSTKRTVSDRAAMAAAVRSFEELREECLQKGELWEDPDFPATQASVFYHQTPPFTFEWKRPNVSDINAVVAVIR